MEGDTVSVSFLRTLALNLINDVNQQEFNEFELLDKDHIIRKCAQRVMNHLYFERISLLAIIVNYIFVAMDDYSHVDTSGNLITANSWRNTVSAQSEHYFTSFFLFEFLVKVTALGFLGDSPAYMSDSWHWLDFIVVMAGWVIKSINNLFQPLLNFDVSFL